MVDKLKTKFGLILLIIISLVYIFNKCSCNGSDMTFHNEFENKSLEKVFKIGVLSKITAIPNVAIRYKNMLDGTYYYSKYRDMVNVRTLFDPDAKVQRIEVIKLTDFNNYDLDKIKLDSGSLINMIPSQSQSSISHMLFFNDDKKLDRLNVRWDNKSVLFRRIDGKNYKGVLGKFGILVFTNRDNTPVFYLDYTENGKDMNLITNYIMFYKNNGIMYLILITGEYGLEPGVLNIFNGIDNVTL
jgi:hypothetical protein